MKKRKTAMKAKKTAANMKIPQTKAAPADGELHPNQHQHPLAKPAQKPQHPPTSPPKRSPKSAAPKNAAP
jgi:hypothetical protein